MIDSSFQPQGVSLIGVDISSSSVKMVELSAASGGTGSSAAVERPLLARRFPTAIPRISMQFRGDLAELAAPGDEHRSLPWPCRRRP